MLELFRLDVIPAATAISHRPFGQLHVRYQQRFDCSNKAPHMIVPSRTAANLDIYPSVSPQEEILLFYSMPQ